MTIDQLQRLYALDYKFHSFTKSMVILADCFEWMTRIPKESIHAIVTDPPYGVKEYDPDQLEKRANGNGGIWRIPPSFDGHDRSPLPRFTALNDNERDRLQRYFSEWAELVLQILRPGGHIFLASNVFLSQTVFTAIADAGFEFRGQVIRLVKTLRGGDRPKNAEQEFPDVCTMPRGCHEPWGIFRKPIPNNMTVSDCLKEFQTGGLRRKPGGNPFEDVIDSERTPQRERNIANHPSLKPQSFLRQIVYASLPLGEGIVVDPFMGSGSTVAAAEAVGYSCIGIGPHFFCAASVHTGRDCPSASDRTPRKGPKETFQARDSLGVKLLVDETQEIYELFHSLTDVLQCQTIGKSTVWIEEIGVHRRRSTSQQFFVFSDVQHRIDLPDC